MEPVSGENSKHTQIDLYASERERMVRRQILSRSITDKAVLEAVSKVPRHRFVPVGLWPYAYDDGPLSIGHNQTISQPYIVAYMTQVLKLDKQSRVLEVGTGSGYQTAILAEVCKAVYSIEVIKELGLRADALLNKLGYRNVTIRIGDGYNGWLQYAPYDAIIVTCAPSDIPEALIHQLAERGRMIIPYGKYGGQKLMLLKKMEGRIAKENVLSVIFVPMVDKSGRSY